MDEKLLKNIYNLIKLIPFEIQDRLKKELDKIEDSIFKFWKVSNKWICYYNFMVELYHVFKERYLFLINISKKNEGIKKIIIEENKKYYSIKDTISNEINENKRRLNDLEEDYSKEKAKIKKKLKKVENKYEVMLINEKDFEDKKPPEIKSKRDKPIYQDLNNELNEKNIDNLNTEKNTGMSIKDLENIDIPKEISILNLSNFYSNCIQNTKILPLIIRDIFLKEKDQSKDFDVIEDNYIKLKNLYIFLINEGKCKKKIHLYYQ